YFFRSKYLAFSTVRTVGLRLIPSNTPQPLRLLLLRGFGAQRRSEALLRTLGAHWRHLGPIHMIAGPDLVATALEPHEFLDLLRGRLSRRFVRDSTDLPRHIAELD